jgi:NADPH2:quinone reductase
MHFEECELPDLGPNQVRVRNEAIGLNFIDVYVRTGLYPGTLPAILGKEGAGVVVATGTEVTTTKVGDRVAYTSAIGSYAEEVVVAENILFPVPDDIELEIAAALLLKGLTVNCLLTMVWPLKANETILFHAAAGGVGTLAMQWARSIGARVIGTAGSREKAELALSNGADEVIDLSAEDFVERVAELTDGKGVDVVYDSLGKDTFEASLDCLRPRGLMVSFGNSTGPVSVPNLGILAAKGSLFVTRMMMAPYYADRAVELKSAAQIFQMARSGVLKVQIGQTFNLSDAADAHRALQARKTTGSTILRP